MSRRKITISPDGELVIIKGYKVAEIARAAGLRPTYSGSAGGWMLDASRLSELVVWLEYRNFRYEIEGRRETPRPDVAIPRPRTEPEPLLW